VQKVVETAAGGATQTPPGSGTTPPAGTGGAPAEPQTSSVTARDTTAPRLSIRAGHKQDILHRKLVRLSVACDEACIVRASGHARGLAMRSVLHRLTARRRVVFVLRASPRVRRALARRGSVSVSVRARDAAGNLSTAALAVRVKR
jgi:hypothetical protein